MQNFLLCDKANNKNKASLEIPFVLSLSVHDAFTRGQSLLSKCSVVAHYLNSSCSVLNCITLTLQAPSIHTYSIIYKQQQKDTEHAVTLIPLILKHVKPCIYVNHTNMSCFAVTMFMHACERTVLACICIMENQVVYESSSLCKTKAPRFVSVLKHPCVHSIHFWTKRTRLGHSLLQVLIIYFCCSQLS